MSVRPSFEELVDASLRLELIDRQHADPCSEFHVASHGGVTVLAAMGREVTRFRRNIRFKKDAEVGANGLTGPAIYMLLKMMRKLEGQGYPRFDRSALNVTKGQSEREWTLQCLRAVRAWRLGLKQ